MEDWKFKIEWHSIVKDLIKNLWVIFLAALIGLMGVYIASKSVYSPEYTAKATVVVNTKSSATGTYSQFSVSVEMADILSKVLVEPTIKDRAIAKAHYDYFDARLTAEVYKGTNFINLSVISDSPQKSYDLLNAVLQVYPEISDNIFENVVISTLSHPEMPHSPSNNISTTNRLLVVGGLAGFVTCIVVFLSVIRDTIKTEDAFTAKIDSKLLGVVPHEKKNRKLKDIISRKNKALLIHSNAFLSLRFVENYHKIAAKIEHHHRNNDSKVFAVTSVAENEGKSTVASNIAISLADRGHRVVLIDVDCKKPALYKIFDKKFNEKSEFGYFMNGKVSNQDFSLEKYKKMPLYLALNTKGYSEYSKWIDSGKLARVVETFCEQVDYVILDTAPLTVDSYVTDMAKIVDETIVVVRTDMVYTSAINDAIVTINESGGKVSGCVLNDVYPEFSFFAMSGADEGGYYYGKSYGKYGKYGKYGRYGKYERYSKYASPYLDDFSEED